MTDENIPLFKFVFLLGHFAPTWHNHCLPPLIPRRDGVDGTDMRKLDSMVRPYRSLLNGYHQTSRNPFLSLSSSAGFSLMEVMIVSAILSIAVSIATPAYLQWSAKTQLRSEMATLAQNLSLARMTAMVRNTTVTVTLDPSVVDPSDGRSKITASFAPPVIPPQRMPVTVTSLTASGGTIPMTMLFSSLGVQFGPPQSFTLTNRYGLTYTATLSPTGTVSWCPRATCP